MNAKVIAFLCVVAFAAWYAILGGRKIDESNVRELYTDYISAFDKEDGKALCKLFDSKVTGRFKSTSRSMSVKEDFDKATACAAVEDVYQKKKLLEVAAGTDLYTNFDATIQSIVISPDKRTATVEVLIETRIGTAQKSVLDMRSQQTDTVTRSFGRMKITRTDGTVSFFH